MWSKTDLVSHVVSTLRTRWKRKTGNQVSDLDVPVAVMNDGVRSIPRDEFSRTERMFRSPKCKGDGGRAGMLLIGFAGRVPKVEPA